MDERSPLAEMVRVFVELLQDVVEAELSTIGTPSQVARRNYVRALFALVEAQASQQQRVAETMAASKPAIEPKVIAASKLEKRKIGRDSVQARLTRDVRVAFAMFATAHESQNPLTGGNPGWEAFEKAVEVRDRITHPQSHIDCLVTDDQLTLVRRAHHWYQELDQKLLRVAGATPPTEGDA